MAKFGIALLWLVSCLSQAQTQILLFADHPIDIHLSQETLNANILNALEQHADGQLHFSYQLVPQNRSWRMLEKMPACLINQIKTPERQAKAYFTHFPLTLYPPLRLIVAQATATSWPAEFTPASYNLPGNNLIGLVKGRSYGEALDIAFAATPQHYFVRGGTEPAERTLDMLIARRISATVDYSRSVRVYLDEIQSPFAFKAIPIAGENSAVAGFIACSKDNQGKAMVEALDMAFAKDAMLEDYIKFHRAFFGDEEGAFLEADIRARHLSLKASH